MSDDKWGHQARAVKEFHNCVMEGHKRIVLTMPTGAGKTKTSQQIVYDYLEAGLKCVLYTNRKSLITQTKRSFKKAGFEVGIRASGHEDERWLPFQISSLQTEEKRLKDPAKYRGWEMHKANLVIIDEAHLNMGPTVADLAAKHVEQGAVILGLTATPVDMAGMYDHLIKGATVSELRKKGVLVPVYTFGCDEPDLRKINVSTELEGCSGAAKKAFMNPTIYARVWEWYCKLNPNQRPTIGFAPGVDESFWFAENFWKKGVPTAHVDGEKIWINGKWYDSDPETRGFLFGDDDRKSALATGEIKVIWNRFVMREGIDIPEIEHVILGTVMGNPKTYLQAIGRGMRAAPWSGKRCLIVQDHGGHWWRAGLGDPNADREWNLEYTSNIIASMQADIYRETPEKIPIRCPKCATIMTVKVCPVCGFSAGANRRTRAVVQLDGTLFQMVGTMQQYAKRTVHKNPDSAKVWMKMYFRGRNSKMTFKQLEANYAKENFWNWPSHDLPYMPREAIDWYRRVSDVPVDRLVPAPPKEYR
jgi:DNA repair protein RadD